MGAAARRFPIRAGLCGRPLAGHQWKAEYDDPLSPWSGAMGSVR